MSKYSTSIHANSISFLDIILRKLQFARLIMYSIVRINWSIYRGFLDKLMCWCLASNDHLKNIPTCWGLEWFNIACVLYPETVMFCLCLSAHYNPDEDEYIVGGKTKNGLIVDANPDNNNPPICAQPMRLQRNCSTIRWV